MGEHTLTHSFTLILTIFTHLHYVSVLYLSNDTYLAITSTRTLSFFDSLFISQFLNSRDRKKKQKLLSLSSPTVELVRTFLTLTDIARLFVDDVTIAFVIE